MFTIYFDYFNPVGQFLLWESHTELDLEKEGNKLIYELLDDEERKRNIIL